MERPIELDTLRAGNPQAVAALFEAYADRIYRLALSLLRDPAAAEDIVQETFLQAITHLDRFEGRSSLGTWLYRIAHNASVDRLRRRPEVPLPAEADDDAPVPMPQSLIDWAWTPEEILGDTEALGQVGAAVDRLPESLRVVFLLRDVERLSTEETAEALEISPGAVKVRLHRARLTLREALSGYFSERVRTTRR
jgi:RNA polymerase sigma-70 factor, ECF subfamily